MRLCVLPGTRPLKGNETPSGFLNLWINAAAHPHQHRGSGLRLGWAGLGFRWQQSVSSILTAAEKKTDQSTSEEAQNEHWGQLMRLR